MNHGWIQVVLGKVNDAGTTTLLQQVLVVEQLQDFIHLVVVEGFTIVGVELNVQHIVNLHETLQGFSPEPLPQTNGFFIAIFQLPEPFTTSFGIFWVFVGFRVDLNVVFLQCVDWVSLDSFFIAPHFVGGHQLTKLGPPVAKVVNLDWVVVDLLHDVGNCVTDNRRTQVTHTHWLGNVW